MPKTTQKLKQYKLPKYIVIIHNDHYEPIACRGEDAAIKVKLSKEAKEYGCTVIRANTFIVGSVAHPLSMARELQGLQ